MRNQKRFTKKLAYMIPGFIVGTVTVASVASAATVLIQAQKQSDATISINGKQIASTPRLVNGGTSYAGLWWLQQGLKKAGFRATWDGNNMNITLPSAPVASNSSVVATGGYKITPIAESPSGLKGLDDVVYMNGHLFVTYQNGVGSKGEASSSGNTNSTIVEYDVSGNQVATWSITGKCDGMGADPANNRVFATVNEDGNSSIYVITPGNAQAQHLTYSPDPASSQATGDLATGGGTDNVVVQDGHIYISASAPVADSIGNYTHAALFEATIQGNQVNLKPVFNDNAQATDAVSGSKVTLNLSDADSSTIVPASSPMYGNSIMLDSQGDSQIVFLQNAGTTSQSLTKLNVGTQLDDVQWATSSNGTLYFTDGGTNTLYAVTGDFTPGTVFVACPGDSGVGGFIGTLDLKTGNVTPVIIGLKSPKGITFVSGK